MAETSSLCQWTCDLWFLTVESRSSSSGTGLLQQPLTLLLLTSVQCPGETCLSRPVARTEESELSQAALTLVPGNDAPRCAACRCRIYIPE